MLDSIISICNSKRDIIESFFRDLESTHEIPLYSSLDIRHSSFKASVVDCNIFPAGFNNLCKGEFKQNASLFQKVILNKNSNTQKILLIMEEHTRNLWYLEHIYQLSDLLEQSGFTVTITTSIPLDVPYENNKVQLQTIQPHLNGTPKILHIKHPDVAFLEIDSSTFILLNNDLVDTIPPLLQPHVNNIYPSPYLGWYIRRKSEHFTFKQDLVNKLSSLLEVDPWFFSCKFNKANHININSEDDRVKMMHITEEVFESIQEKYIEYNIKTQPRIFIKSDFGTYGMSVLSLNHPKDILKLNRKMRNNLRRSKGSVFVNHYLIQEGIPSMYTIDNKIAEVCLYTINSQYAGSFFRMHKNKSSLDSLNSPGMEFESIGYGETSECKDYISENVLYFYLILARLSNLATSKERDYFKELSLKNNIVA